MYFVNGIRFDQKKFKLKLEKLQDNQILTKLFFNEKTQMHENLKYTVIKHLTKKTKKYSQFQNSYYQQ